MASFLRNSRRGNWPDGFCILGGISASAVLADKSRDRAAVLSQPIGHRPENPDVMYKSGRDVWAPEFRKRQPNVSMETIEKYLHNLYRAQPDFVYSVSRDFVRSCQTPMLVLPDDTDAHTYQGCCQANANSSPFAPIRCASGKG